MLERLSRLVLIKSKPGIPAFRSHQRCRGGGGLHPPPRAKLNSRRDQNNICPVSVKCQAPYASHVHTPIQSCQASPRGINSVARLKAE